MNAKLIKVIEEWEEELRHNGYHIGVTGSTLYGMGTGKDLDVIVYPHIYPDNGINGITKAPVRLSPSEICKLLGVKNPKALGKDDGYSGSPWIWSGMHVEIGRVDVLFMRGNTHCDIIHDAEGCGILPDNFES